MELKSYLGYKVDAVKGILNNSNIKYKIIETKDSKNTRMGNDLRVVKISESNDIVSIYVSYF